MGKPIYKQPIVWVVVAVLFFAGAISLSAPYFEPSKIPFIGSMLGGTTASVAGTPSGPTSVASDGTVCQRPTGGNTATLGVLVRNTQNSTYEQMASTTWLTDLSGVTQTSVTTTDAAAKAYASMTPVPCIDGYLYTLADTDTNSQKVKADSLVPNQNKEIQGSKASRLLFSVYTNTLGNDSSNGNVQNSVEMNTSTHAIASGGSFQGYIDVDFQQASAQFGSDDGGIIVAVDHNLAVYSRENGVKVTSQTGGVTLSPISCPSDVVTYLNGDTCYKISALNKNTPTPVRLSYTVKADLGEPGASDDVSIFFQDNQYFLDQDGTIRLGAFNSAGTDQGVARNRVTVDVS